MKFKRQILITVLSVFLLGGAVSIAKAEQPSWMLEIPRVVCLKNKLWIVWIASKYSVQVKGIFCSMDEDLV